MVCRHIVVAGLLTSLFCCTAAYAADDAPVVEETPTSKALAALPPKPLAQRVPVTIYEFRSGIPDVNGEAATDLFYTALIQSHQFRVVERQRLSQGVAAEKQLNGSGLSTGTTAQKQVRGARYIFEGTISEGNGSEDSHQGGINIGGLNLGGGKNKDKIAIDVRIVDADTGDVLDSVAVSKTLKDTSAAVSGTAALASTLLAMRGQTSSPLTPDVNYQGSHKESVDRALRACIESAVLTLVQRVELPAGDGSAQ